MSPHPTFDALNDVKDHYRGETYLSGRHTPYDFNFLRPTDESVSIAEYAFALGCEKGRQVVHVETWFPSFRRGLLSCPSGDRCVFHHWVHLTFSKLNNPLIGNVGHPTWKPDELIEPKLSDGFAPRLRTASTPSPFIETTLLEELSSPASDHFADNRSDYAGFTVGVDDWGTARLVHRPAFAPEGYPPDAVMLALPTLDWLDRLLAIEDTESSPELLDFCRTVGTLTPAQYEYLQHEVEQIIARRRLYPELPDHHPIFWRGLISPAKLAEAKAHYSAKLADTERRLRAKRRKSGPRVLGKRRLQNLDPWSHRGQERAPHAPYGVPPGGAPRPRPPERPEKGPSREDPPPRFIGPAKWVETMRSVGREFRRRHRRALNAWRNGRNFEISFPYGTVRARLQCNVVVRDGP